MPHRHVSSGVEHALVGENAAGGSEIVEDGRGYGHDSVLRYCHGITDTWMAPGAPSPPTDLIA